MTPEELPISQNIDPTQATYIAQRREEFVFARNLDFTEEFCQAQIDEFSRWGDLDWTAWRKRHQGLEHRTRKQIEQQNPRRSKRDIDDMVKKQLRAQYRKESPCPNYDIMSQMRKNPRAVPEIKTSWPGYEETKAAWDAETRRLWADHEASSETEGATHVAFIAQQRYDGWLGRRRAHRENTKNAVNAAVTSETVGQWGTQWPVLNPETLIQKCGEETQLTTKALAKDGTERTFIRINRDVAIKLREGDGQGETQFLACGSWLDITDRDSVTGVSQRSFNKRFRRVWV